MPVSPIARDLETALRRLEERYPGPFPVDRAPRALEEASLPTGIDRLDALLPGGGLPRGALIELSGAPSSGKTSLTLALIAAAQRRAESVAYVDPERSFFAPSAQAAGIDLEQLLLVRPTPRSAPRSSRARRPDTLAGFRVIDHLLRSKWFSLLVLDLGGPFRPPPLDRLFRISRLARVGETVTLLLTETDALRPSLGSPVSLRLTVTRTGFRFTPKALSPFALGGLRVRVAVRKSKFGPAGGPGNEVSLDLLPDAVA